PPAPVVPPAPAPPPSSEATVVPESLISGPTARRPDPDRAATARWRVSFDTGETFVVEGLALVGRRPEPRVGELVKHLVPLRSSDMSVSKTHAQFQVVPDGALVVMDRGSTNGSVVVRQGVSKSLTAGRPSTLLDGDTVRFGDRTMIVAKDRP
ncbi:FHA domain-containing protein, partial [Nocardioides sp.]|uniref:FHA domain-containing protein n=1 Tax=Nocardioides sp. TaxID=35761 RepID=UPI002719DBE9